MSLSGCRHIRPKAATAYATCKPRQSQTTPTLATGVSRHCHLVGARTFLSAAAADCSNVLGTEPSVAFRGFLRTRMSACRRLPISRKKGLPGCGSQPMIASENTSSRMNIPNALRLFRQLHRHFEHPYVIALLRLGWLKLTYFPYAIHKG